jgi:hypothetical protein
MSDRGCTTSVKVEIMGNRTPSGMTMGSDRWNYDKGLTVGGEANEEEWIGKAKNQRKESQEESQEEWEVSQRSRCRIIKQWKVRIR